MIFVSALRINFIFLIMFLTQMILMMPRSYNFLYYSFRTQNLNYDQLTSIIKDRVNRIKKKFSLGAQKLIHISRIQRGVTEKKLQLPDSNIEKTSRPSIISEKKENQDIQPNIFERKQATIIGFTPQITMKVQDDDQLVYKEEEEIFKNREVFLQHTFNQMIQCKTQIKMKVKYLFARLFCRKLFYANDYDVQRIDKAVSLIKQDLDIETLMDRIQEIDKLKKLLLDNHQITLFNYTLRPVIQWNKQADSEKKETKIIKKGVTKNLENQKPIQKSQTISEMIKQAFEPKASYDTVEDLMKLYQAYDVLIHANQQYNHDQQKQENDRLAQLLGKQLIDIFEVSYSLPPNIKNRFLKRQNALKQNQLGNLDDLEDNEGNYQLSIPDEQNDAYHIPQEEKMHHNINLSKKFNTSNLKSHSKMFSPRSESNQIMILYPEENEYARQQTKKQTDEVNP